MLRSCPPDAPGACENRLFGLAVPRLEGPVLSWRRFRRRAGSSTAPDVFDTVEINNSFYRLPSRETVNGWRARAPRGFLFAVKASRYLTHMRKLKDPRDPLDLLFDRARRLGPHLGPVLYQLPPRWKEDPERLTEFLEAIPRDVKQAIEFRDPSWYRTTRSRRWSGTAWRSACTTCRSRRRRAPPSARSSTCDFTVPAESTPAATATPSFGSGPRGWPASFTGGRDCYAYFNNDREGHAVTNAITLRTEIKRLA